MTTKLSVVIITYNEEHNISRCIESVKSIADEILVVDSHSTDNTIDVAQRLGAKVLIHSFEGHIQQKNWAKDQAEFPFVLSLDADECLSPELQESILSEKKQGFHFSGYNMNRLNFVKNRPIKGCGWYPDKKLRLFNITQGKWRGKNPHDTFVLNFGLSKQHLKGEIYHYSYASHSAIFKQAIKFGKIGAKSVRSLNFLVLMYKLIFSPPTKFLRNYFLKLGIIYGLTGLVICLGQVIECYIKYGGGILRKLNPNKTPALKTPSMA
jgi:glycosyltransferase involved in cell wall biosynthesis